MAANSTASTTVEGMHQAIAHMGNAHATAKQGMITVADLIAALKSTWTGEASVAFDNSMKLWFEDCEIIVRKLDEMMELMGVNAKDINAGEQANIEQALRMPVGGGGLAGL